MRLFEPKNNLYILNLLDKQRSQFVYPVFRFGTNRWFFLYEKESL